MEVVMSLLKLCETLLRVLIKMMMVAVAFVVALIAGITWKK